MRSARPSTAAPETRASGAYGSIPDPAQSYLPAHPDTFAELSVLAHNPASDGYVHVHRRQRARDPAVHERAARLARRSQRAAVQARHRLRAGTRPAHRKRAALPPRSCGGSRSPRARRQQERGHGLTRSRHRRRRRHWKRCRNPSAEARSAGRRMRRPAAARKRWRSCRGSAPGSSRADSRRRAWPRRPRSGRWSPPGNRLYGTAYLYGGGHGTSLDSLQPAYDCSSAVSYLLHWGGVLGANALDSSELESYGLPGPGRYVTIYANAVHAFIYVAGLRLDTVEDPAYDCGPNSGQARARAGGCRASVPGWASLERAPPRRAMSSRRSGRSCCAALALAALALGGCSNPDAPARPPACRKGGALAGPGEPGAPPPPPPRAHRRERRSRAPRRRSASSRCSTSTGDTRPRRRQQTLAAISVGAARTAELQAAASSAADRTIRRARSPTAEPS